MQPPQSRAERFLSRFARFSDDFGQIPFLPSGQKLVADDDQPGLYLKVGKTAKSWVVQTEVRVLDDKMKPSGCRVERGDVAPFSGAHQERAGA